ncbi:MAG: UDP-N-acetylmuramate--L-alanine ligase [Chitinophagaceae bacterium]|nr:UDP-N-acetylmuramate--L-alanine ligase [Chitinophagaceae bacterium]
MNTPFRGKQVYFIGIGGIGMSALARYFHTQGALVSGYDKTSTPLTRELEASGIGVHYNEDLTKVPPNAELVVYTPAIPKEHQELVFLQQQGYNVVKRSDVLQMISNSSFNICIAGTHGKTTITTMIAHLLRDSGYGCNAFLGGISVNYGTNFWSHERNVCVIEADEYDRSFLKLSPDIAVITAMDADHLDIYGTAEEMEKAFIEFTGKVKPSGKLVSKFGLKRGKDLLTPDRTTYSLQNESADVYAANIRMKSGSYTFDVVMKDNLLNDVVLHMGGMHNVENITAAIAVASSLGIENEKIKSAVENFRGVKRRFEYIIKTDNQVFIDDYAHHPEELRALITGAKSLFAGKTCTVIFQPHLFTRTRDHADGFAEVLDLADRVVLLPIYPARELPIEGVNSEMILDRMKNPNRELVKKEDLMSWAQQYAKTWNKELGNVLVTAGAGDIDGELVGIKEILNKS